MTWTVESIYLGVVLSGLLYVLYSGRLRPDVGALLVMVALMLPWRPTPEGLAPVLSPAQALSGFGSPAVLMVAAMFVLSAAVVHTGAADMIGRSALESGASSELRFQVTVLVLVTLFSAFVNDTTTVLIWMPLVLRTCRERGYAPGRLLMLLAYGSLLGGQWTLIGTRSNILLSDYLATRTGSGIGFFAFTPTAVLIAIGSLVFFVVYGRRLLPQRSGEPTLAARYEVQEFVTEVIATPAPDAAGRTLGELGLDERHGVAILGVVRGGNRMAPAPWMRLLEGDVLIVRGRMESIPRVLAERGLSPRREMAVGGRELRSVDLRLVEAVVAPHSQLVGKSLEDLDFDRRYGVSPLAISRSGQSLRERPLSEQLLAGDSILLLGHERELERLATDPEFYLMESQPQPVLTRWRTYATLGLLLLVALSAATGLLAPAFVIPAAAVTALLLGCVSIRKAYESIDLPALVVVGCLIPFGLAVETTGTAHALGEAVGLHLATLGPAFVLAALLLVTVLVTQLVDNAAVAIVLAPVAYELAIVSNVEPATFLTAVAICTSAAFMTPIAHESTILVMGAGRYTFRDYLRLGVPFSAITLLVTWGTTVLWNGL